jgi:hypothetical protein
MLPRSKAPAGLARTTRLETQQLISHSRQLLIQTKTLLATAGKLCETRKTLARILKRAASRR